MVSSWEYRGTQYGYWEKVAGMKKYAFFPLALLAAVVFPLLILVAAGIALHENEWRLRRRIVDLVCSIDSDCPPGYVCVSGRCIPANR